MVILRGDIALEWIEIPLEVNGTEQNWLHKNEPVDAKKGGGKKP
jgi:hypothetical protein